MQNFSIMCLEFISFSFWNKSHQTFPVKIQATDIFGFVSCMLSFTPRQFCENSHRQYMNELAWLCFKKLYLDKQVHMNIWFIDCVLPALH